MKFKLYNRDNAPQHSKPLLEKSINDFGVIPNLHAMLAVSPATLEAYQILHQLFQHSSFNKEELTVVWQTINVEHECHYCVPAHSAIAIMMGVDHEIDDALRDGHDIANEKLQVLHQTTLALVRNRGHLSNQENAAFYTAGFERRHLLEIILGISQKVISNYSNHLADTPVDKQFSSFKWTKKFKTPLTNGQQINSTSGMTAN